MRARTWSVRCIRGPRNGTGTDNLECLKVREGNKRAIKSAMTVKRDLRTKDPCLGVGIAGTDIKEKGKGGWYEEGE